MRATIDESTCTGCGLCEGECPEVFKMDNDAGIAKVIADPVPANAIEKCRGAAAECPSEAIKVSD